MTVDLDLAGQIQAFGQLWYTFVPDHHRYTRLSESDVTQGMWTSKSLANVDIQNRYANEVHEPPPLEGLDDLRFFLQKRCG